MASRPITTVYHLLDARNWASVKRQGLKSAKRLATDLGYDPRTLRKHRKSDLVVSSGARIRDQSPMPPHVLNRCLRDGLKPEDWYDLLNSKVFFWVDPKRLNRQRRAYADAPQCVLVIDAIRMLEKHSHRTAVTPINTGNAMRAAASRGLSTFVPWARWKSDAWGSENIGRPVARPPTHRPVELTIEDAVADIFDYAQSVVFLEPKQNFVPGLAERHINRS